jgi:FkbM family methyltransferase
MNPEEIVSTLDEVYFDQAHERETLVNLGLILKDGDHFVDIGSSLGQYPCFLNHRFRNLSILCLEPDPIRFEELERRCHDWSLAGRNRIAATRAAAGAEDGVVTFYTTSSNVSGSIADADFKARLQELDEMTRRGIPGRTAPPDLQVTAIEVPASTLDSICGEADPELVKIDVEGAEYEVVQGAAGLLRNGHTRFLVEVDKRADNDSMRRLFDNNGYRSLRFFNHTLFFHPQGPRVPRVEILLRRIFYKLTRSWLPSRPLLPAEATPTSSRS